MEIRPPHRATHSYTQHLHGTPDEVFSLLCPVREAEWLERWDPLIVLSESGLAEDGCVFVTAEGDDEAVWMVTRHEPEVGFIEMVKIVPHLTACRLSIQLAASPVGTDAIVTYSHTSLGPDGDAFVDGFDSSYYARFMGDWERRLDHYLMTGEMLRPDGQ